MTYSTFDSASIDVLRLDFVPESVLANGRPLPRRKVLDQPGFTFDDLTHVLRIRHDTARDIDIQGTGGTRPASFVTFDDPHLAAGTGLAGGYPSGVIDWPPHQWKIGTPAGKFGTFNLIAADNKAEVLAFSFAAPRVFVGVDVYNAGPQEADLEVQSGNLPGKSFIVKPGELRRLRTGWGEVSSRVELRMKNADGLRFDYLAYLPE